MKREMTGHTVTQCKLIYDYLTKHQSIDQYEAAELFSCWRLSARIADLRSKGIQIKREMIQKKNKYGHTVRFARYSLEVEK